LTKPNIHEKIAVVWADIQTLQSKKICLSGITRGDENEINIINHFATLLSIFQTK
jgi:hypothetical protein